MKVLKMSLICLSMVFTLAAQIQVGTPWTGRSYTTESMGRDNERFLRQADIHYRLGNIEETFFALQSAVESNPQSPHALLQRANFKHLLGMETEAAQDVVLANRLNPYAADLYGYNGPNSPLRVLAYQPENALGELDFAKRNLYYYEALDLAAAEESNDNMELELLNEILIEIEENRLEDALSLLYSLISLYSESAIAYDLKGVVLYKQKKYVEAEAALSKSVGFEPDFAIAWYNLSLVKRAQGQLEQAKRFLDKAIEQQADLTKAYFDRALVKKSLGDKEGALEDYNKVIDMRGEYYLEAYLNRGLTRKMLGDFNGALADLDKVIEEQPRNGLLYKNRGNLHFLFGNYNKAINDYTRAIFQDQNFAEAYYNRGLARFLVYDNTEACMDLTKSKQLGYERAEEKLRYFCSN